jgi:hypothetical protein
MDGMKKSEGVFEIFRAKQKFKRNLLMESLTDYLKIIIFNILSVIMSLKHSIKTQ